MIGMTNNGSGISFAFKAYILVKTDPYASVTATSLAGVILSGTADSLGNLILETTSPGTYTVTASLSGVSTSVTVVVADNGSIVEAIVYIEYTLFDSSINRLGASADWRIYANAHEIEISSDSITIRGYYNGGPYGIFSANAFDVTDYDYLVITGQFDRSGQNMQVGICGEEADGGIVSRTTVIGSTTFTSTQTLTDTIICDISSYSGNYYFFCKTNGNDGTSHVLVNTLTINEAALTRAV